MWNDDTSAWLSVSNSLKLTGSKKACCYCLMKFGGLFSSIIFLYFYSSIVDFCAIFLDIRATL